jgi:hypothetical protein
MVVMLPPAAGPKRSPEAMLDATRALLNNPLGLKSSLVTANNGASKSTSSSSLQSTCRPIDDSQFALLGWCTSAISYAVAYAHGHTLAAALAWTPRADRGPAVSLAMAPPEPLG